MAWGTKLMAWAPLAEGKNGLFAMQDKQYAAFQAKLTPGVEKTALLPGRTTKPFRRPSRITSSAEAINPS